MTNAASVALRIRCPLVVSRSSVLDDELTTRYIVKMSLQHLKMTGDLLAISDNARVPSDRVLYELISTSESTVEHVLLATHGWPSNKRYGVMVSRDTDCEGFDRECIERWKDASSNNKSRLIAGKEQS